MLICVNTGVEEGQENMRVWKRNENSAVSSVHDVDVALCLNREQGAEVAQGRELISCFEMPACILYYMFVLMVHGCGTTLQSRYVKYKLVMSLSVPLRLHAGDDPLRSNIECGCK